MVAMKTKVGGFSLAQQRQLELGFVKTINSHDEKPCMLFCFAHNAWPC